MKKKFEIEHTFVYNFGFYLFPTIIIEKISCRTSNGIEFAFRFCNIGYDVVIWKRK